MTLREGGRMNSLLEAEAYAIENDANTPFLSAQPMDLDVAKA